MAKLKIYLNLSPANGIDYQEFFSEEFDISPDARRIILRGTQDEKTQLENTYVDIFAKKRFGKVKKTVKGETKDTQTYLGIWFDKRPNDFKDKLKITDFNKIKEDLLVKARENLNKTVKIIQKDSNVANNKLSELINLLDDVKIGTISSISRGSVPRDIRDSIPQNITSKNVDNVIDTLQKYSQIKEDEVQKILNQPIEDFT